MKKYLVMLTALGMGATASAQEVSQPTSSPEIREFLNSPTFIKSIVGGYGVTPDISPELNRTDIEAVQENATFLQSDDPEQLQVAAQNLEQYMEQQETEEEEFSAAIPQIIGSVYFRLSTLAEAETERERYRQQGVDFLQQAVEKFPSFRQAHKNLARLYFQMGTDEAMPLAMKHFARSIELGDKEAATFILLAKLYYDSERYVAAEAAARQAIMMDPDIKEARTILAYSLFSQERFQEAQGVFKEMLQDDPDNADVWQMVANTYIQSNEISEAANRLEIVRFMGEAQSSTLLLLGDVYMNKSMTEDAKQVYSEALQLALEEPNDPILDNYVQPIEHLNNFQAYDLAKELLDEVESAFSGDLDNDQRNDLLALRSEINIALGEGEAAAQNLKDILDIDPMNRRALLSLGEYYSRLTPEDRQERQEAVETALSYFRRAQELINTGNSRDEDAARQAFVGEGQLLARERRLNEALAALEEAQQIEEEDRIASYIDMIRQVINQRG